MNIKDIDWHKVSQEIPLIFDFPPHSFNRVELREMYSDYGNGVFLFYDFLTPLSLKFEMSVRVVFRSPFDCFYPNVSITLPLSCGNRVSLIISEHNYPPQEPEKAYWLLLHCQSLGFTSETSLLEERFKFLFSHHDLMEWRLAYTNKLRALGFIP